MEHWAEEYERLRADYNAAFAGLCAEESRLQSIEAQGRMDASAEAAMGAYRECRERLARFLISFRPTGRIRSCRRLSDRERLADTEEKTRGGLHRGGRRPRG